jgi:hypothetical protein
VLRSCRANSKNGRKTKPGSLASGRGLGLSERLQKNSQVRSLFVAQLNSDRCWFAFNSNVQGHLNIAPRIPRVEIFYIGKNVWLNAIDLHCHSGPSCETESLTARRCRLARACTQVHGAVSPGAVERLVVINSNLYLEPIFGKRPNLTAGKKT